MDSETLETTPAQACSSFAKSSACCTRASRVPILKLGMLQASKVPLSEAMAFKVLRASSLSEESKAWSGSDTRAYCDTMFEYRTGLRG
jgi:hypothetical protein